ncbi:hypothetical protein B7C62_16745 [Kitasatospora albolonga]|uniref:Uncharacterized protein n=1 Tax=Kitasatospora albolonga TaxID=68173 RepID=A0ABC8BVD9_9ACTN|nr:hypothetical protein B7C62_16745 [Kitasatospora albolonga]
MSFEFVQNYLENLLTSMFSTEVAFTFRNWQRGQTQNRATELHRAPQPCHVIFNRTFHVKRSPANETT